MRGTHCLKTWSATQKAVTLSSGEAELLAAVKTSCEVLGMVQMGQDLGCPMEAAVMVDSNAALGIVGRKGNGKLRHVRIGHLWVQEVAESGELAYKKVDTKSNVADLFTKNLSRPDMEKFMEKMCQDYEHDRAKSSLSINRLGRCALPHKYGEKT